MYSAIFTAAIALFAASAQASPVAAQSGLQERATAQCGFSDHGAWIHWTVVIPNDRKFDGDNCGTGFLDNFRGRCGVISSWGCDRAPNPDDVVLNFDTVAGCSGNDISAAINAASYGDLNIDCGPQ